jgi:hypothetical protein
VLVIRFHGYRGKGQVGAVDTNGGGLGEACAWVRCLHCGVNSHSADTQDENEVDLSCELVNVTLCRERTVTYGDGRLVHRAVRMGEEDVHDDGDGNATQVHAKSRTNKKATPKLRVGVLNLLNAVFGPGMRKVDQQNQAEKQEQDGAAKCDIVPPDLKEGVRDQERKDYQAQPCDNLRSPETILNGRAAVFRAVDTQEQYGVESVEAAESEVDAVDSSEAEALLASTVDGNVVEENAL